jgi:HK97 gp10 family phage protein
MTVVVIGLDKATNFLDKMPEFVMQTADKLMAACADTLVEVAKGYVPVRTGALQRSIHVTRIDTCLYLVGSDLGYAGFVEFGTRFMRAQPFLFPALDAAVPRIISSIASMIGQLQANFLL